MDHMKRETRVVASGQDIEKHDNPAFGEDRNARTPSTNTDTLGGGLLAKLSGYLKGEYVFLTASSDLTLDQLYRKLILADAEDTRARTRFQEMMYVMASDLRAERDAPLAGLPAGLARPMSAWRERYNELDRYLSR